MEQKKLFVARPAKKKKKEDLTLKEYYTGQAISGLASSGAATAHIPAAAIKIAEETIKLLENE